MTGGGIEGETGAGLRLAPRGGEQRASGGFATGPEAQRRPGAAGEQALGRLGGGRPGSRRGGEQKDGPHGHIANPVRRPLLPVRSGSERFRTEFEYPAIACIVAPLGLIRPRRGTLAELLTHIAGELALFAGVGFLLFAANDLLVDIIYFGRRLWRAATVYSRFPRSFASALERPAEPGFFAIFVPAWDESAVIASMLKATLQRFEHPNYRIFVGHYRNDPATASAIAAVADDRVEAVRVEVDGPTTKADCLNHLYDALVAYEIRSGKAATAVVLHDAEDLVHPLELVTFERLIGKAALIQLPVLPLIDPHSRWVGGHYCDEFAEAHGKELVVREAVGAAIPLAGVGCAIGRDALARVAAAHEGRPFAGTSMTEDYELGLRIGAPSASASQICDHSRAAA